MAYELIAFDMDGTLLDSNKEVLPSTVAAVAEAQAAGKTVAIATGRSPQMILDYRRILPGVRFATCSAGAMVYDLGENRALYVQPMENALVKKVIAEADRVAGAGNYILKVGAADAIYMEERELAMTERCGIGIYTGILRAAATLVPDAHAVALDPATRVCKMVLHFPKISLRDELHAALADEDLMISDCEVSSVEFTAAGVNKGSALERLTEVLGLGLSQAIAVGDAANDVAMLRAAGLGVAMGNALPEAVAAADVQVADCDHDGCAEAIHRFLLA